MKLPIVSFGFFALVFVFATLFWRTEFVTHVRRLNDTFINLNTVDNIHCAAEPKELCSIVFGVITTAPKLASRGLKIHETWGKDVPYIYYYTDPWHQNLTDFKGTLSETRWQSVQEMPIVPLYADRLDRECRGGEHARRSPTCLSHYGAWKDIPALRHMWQTHPNFEWYMLIDDDTYVFLPALWPTLQQHLRNETAYVGKNVYYSEEDMGMVQGGAGILFNHFTMSIVSQWLDECELTEFHWAGDIRLGACLRHRYNITKIRPNSHLEFYAEHPYELLFGHPNPQLNLAPITFHGLKRITQTYLWDEIRKVEQSKQGLVTFENLIAGLTAPPANWTDQE